MSWASPFRFESRPGSRADSATTTGTIDRRSVPPTPKYDYNYARSPTPVYRQRVEGGRGSGPRENQNKTQAAKKKGKRRGKRRRREAR